MDPICSNTLTNLLDWQEQPRKIAVAVSGGADSMAVLHMTQKYAAQHKIQLFALTVDHGLRPESAIEAKNIANWCEKQKINHKTLIWTDPKPAHAIQDTARIARRRLLLESCHAHSIPFLVLGHQADDQAETVLMRMQRGTGLRGMLGMGFETIDEASDVTILRPALSIRRHALRDYCTQNNIPFIDDPSNEDTQFERVRVRQALSHLPDLADGLILSLSRLSDINETLDHLATEWLEESLEPIDDQTVWLPHDFINDLYPPVQQRVLEGALLEVMPDEATSFDIPLDGLERLLESLQDPHFRGQTLAGIQIKPHKADGINGYLLCPEPKRQERKK